MSNVIYRKLTLEECPFINEFNWNSPYKQNLYLSIVHKILIFSIIGGKSHLFFSGYISTLY